MRARLAVLLVVGCAHHNADSTDAPTCNGGKCDLPTDPSTRLCDLRRADAYNPDQGAYASPDFVRWSCADARGVTDADRGQEYCEYFALLQLDTTMPATSYGLNLGDSSAAGTTPPGVALAQPQIDALSADTSNVVGQCVFTSWNMDIDTPPTRQQQLLGVAVDATTFRMKFRVNAAAAGRKLVTDCSIANPNDQTDPFLRGCMLDDTINHTSFRKSDTDVCALSVHLAECQCHAPVDFATALSPDTRRGFPLATWSDPHGLPPGCRYIDLGNADQTVVSCDITAGDALSGQFDLKEMCRTKYADNVVVHVPLPSSQITCDACQGPNPWTL